MKKIFGKIKKIVLITFFYGFRIFPIKNNKIAVVNYCGKGFGDNPKYIVKALLDIGGGGYDIVWLVRGKAEGFPFGVRTVEHRSLRAVFEMVTARVWIDNARKPLYVRKRKGQYYIMTWHGTGPLKKVEKDALTLSSSYIKSAKRDSKMADLFLSDSPRYTVFYRSAFWYEGEILKRGLPREDILFRREEAAIREIKERLGIKTEEKVVLYAPTFRRTQGEDNICDFSMYSLDWEGLLKSLSKRFGGKWRGIIRLHPNISRFSSELSLSESVINATDYSDMQELLLISEFVITDYSSNIIEAGKAGIKGLLYAVDLEEYKKDRDFYTPLEELPFPLTKNNEELLEAVSCFDEEAYRENLRRFFQDVYPLYPNQGHASECVAEKIFSLCAGGK